MLDVLTWWLLLELIGIAVLPVAFRFFRNLPDRGYAFIKPLGLLLIAYPFWLLTSLGFLTNTRGAIVAVGIAVAAVSWWFLGRQSPVASQQSPVNNDATRNTQHDSPLTWLKQNLSIVLTTELIFTVAYVAWVIVRAYMPDILGTEKPMELAFLNGVLQSDHFPPLDPWLSGYAISYYYFGYVIIGMLTLLSGIASSVTFNLTIAMLFALGATGAFGLAYNLIRQSTVDSQQSTVQSPTSNLQHLIFSLFAPIFLVLIGNLEGFFEALHAKGIGSPEFWQWLDVKGLADAPVTNSFVPDDNWWWWRASRVIHDVIPGQNPEVIDEFPQFSFLLGDMHPHVLALPFVLLALAVALNLLNSESRIQNPESTQNVTAGKMMESPITTEIASSPTASRLLAMTIPNLELGIWNLRFLLLPLILGGLFFLNSWDILPYGFILIAAFAIARYRASNGWNPPATRDLAIFIIALGVLSVVLYLPFYVGFQSQAGGILPTLFVKTRLHQYLIIFGLFLFILGVFLVRLGIEQKLSLREWFNRAGPFLTAAISFPFLVAILALAILALTPALQDQARAAVADGSGNLFAMLLGAYLAPWLTNPWLFVVLAIFLATLAVLIQLRFSESSTTFVLLIAFTGLLLTFGVEFVYLRDQFGTRMNTVFKFYFQTWTLLSIAGAYGVFYLSHALSGIARAAWFVGLAILLGASMIYPTLAIPNRANGFQSPPTLDGIAWIRNVNPSDYAVIQWLNANAPRGSTILEAPGGEYSYGNRISMATGLPTVLGWAGHESQWRGGDKLFKDETKGIDRRVDVQRMYQTLDSKELLTLLDKYDIKFVVVGREEKNQYALSRTQIDKFGKVMALAFETDDARVYTRAQ
ncbi:MAG: hypothetical protein HZB51_33335 [Chloroflexi bacterium]|nr:hypothetical protein [Chloroflexota bacterium]